MSTPKKLVQFNLLGTGTGLTLSSVARSTTTLAIQCNEDMLVGDENGQTLSIVAGSVFSSSQEEIDLRGIYVNAPSGSNISVTYYRELI